MKSRMQVTFDEFDYLLSLCQLKSKDKSWSELATDIYVSGSAKEIYDESFETTLIDDPSKLQYLQDAHKTKQQFKERGYNFVSILDDNYPQKLLTIHENPPFLFYRGKLEQNEQAMSVVGTRNPSTKGIKITQDITQYLCSKEITVIAGLAQGIDTVAHQSALNCNFRTVAFLGSGINQIYPKSNILLADTIIESDGVIFSQFFPDQPPTKYTFPMRNALMSGYGIGSIIIEASEHSGTRNQARMAVAHGRPVILTSLVYDNTKWGKEISRFGCVHVASTTRELYNLVDMLIENDNKITNSSLEDLLESI